MKISSRPSDYARQVDVYTEYSLYATMLQEPDPLKAMKLADTLEQRNPKSQYIAMVMPRYSAVARQANALPAAVAYGERAFERGQYSEDMLLVMADQYIQQKKNPEKVITLLAEGDRDHERRSKAGRSNGRGLGQEEGRYDRAWRTGWRALR